MAKKKGNNQEDKVNLQDYRKASGGKGEFYVMLKTKEGERI